MSQWSSLLSKVASISLKMAESTFIFMTSATCHLEIVFGRLGVVLFICCFVFKVCENIQSLFPKKNHAILILDITVHLVYTWCVLSLCSPFLKTKHQYNAKKKFAPGHPTNSLSLLLGLTSGMNFFMVDMP